MTAYILIISLTLSARYKSKSRAENTNLLRSNGSA